MRWVGIDEAGYGPNLGPLVMTAVIAEGPDQHPPNLWHDLPATICRAGEDPARLWVDDSKLIYHARKGRDRLQSACLAVTSAASGASSPPTLGALLQTLRAGSLQDAELHLWLDDHDPPINGPPPPAKAFDGAPWRITSVLTEVLGPSRFNAGLDVHSSKAKVHFSAFARLLNDVWNLSADGTPCQIRADKHGGRHFYYEPLLQTFPSAWIDRGPEGPPLSQYTIRQGQQRLHLSLLPRADSQDGLVALASIVSKTVRELWMDAFNAHWLARIPGLPPTAGYPLDARRFRQAIEPLCSSLSLPPSLWWRAK